MVIWYGGDYNPEQWPREVWDEDVTLMQRAGVNFATVGVFAWAKLEPREGEFDFEWLDVLLDTLHAGGVRVDLATATASPPPWLTHRYPEVLPVTESGVRLAAGSRQQYCPSSPVYRRLAARLVAALAERYSDHPALELWHVNNEYGCHVSHCYCSESAAAFRVWLESRYTTVDALNAAWGTSFWSQQYGGFDEVYPPSAAPTFRNPAHLLDFDRFSSDELLACYRAEAAIVRAANPKIPVTTNFMGFFKGADYWRWASEIDIISDDSYPDPADPLSAPYAAMTRDLMRSLGEGRPWILMEQAPSAVNWRARNAPKRPGQMRAWSFQAVARGADGIAFFQWRQSTAGAEKFHSAMIPHAGTETRVWREIEALGAELRDLPPLSAGSSAKVAIVVDWDSWWSIEQDSTPGDISYREGLFAWYRTLWERNVAVDFVRASSNLSSYTLVIAPSLFVATAQDLINLDAFARSGGQLVVTYQTAITDENARISPGGYLGSLQKTLGVRVEEFAPPAGPDLAATGLTTHPAVTIRAARLGQVSASVWSEYIHVDGAETIATFSDGDLRGWPAITRNGSAWYFATLPDDAARGHLVDDILALAGVATRLAGLGVEVVQRGDVTFAINHSDATVKLPFVDRVSLSPQGVAMVTNP